MGADLDYVGTRFINTLQSRAPQGHQQMIIDAISTDIIHTPAVTGVHSNFMKQSLAAAGYDMQALLEPGSVNFGAKLTPTGSDSSKAWQDVWSAGHGVAGIFDTPDCDTLIDQMIEEYANTFMPQS
ncbi:hypothetical protein HQQ94_09420 [Shewanella sp. VB17]|nr:hypothetical protein [Shewanella sp. VB17]